jgi:Ca2+-binding RTX toxin-like protein
VPMEASFGRYLGDSVTVALSKRRLSITATSGDDIIHPQIVAGRFSITGIQRTFALGSFSRIRIHTLAGNDTIDLSALNISSAVDGGSVDDILLGGSANDSLLGGAGNDTLFGGDGNDYLNGVPSADQVFGDAGNDQLFAADAARDSLNGGAGFDRIKPDLSDRRRNTEALLA